MGPVNQAGQKGVFRCVLLGIAPVPIRWTAGATVNECAATLNPFSGEQFVAGDEEE
jgi:hypothetical protein